MKRSIAFFSLSRNRKIFLISPQARPLVQVKHCCKNYWTRLHQHCNQLNGSFIENIFGRHIFSITKPHRYYSYLFATFPLIEIGSNHNPEYLSFNIKLIEHFTNFKGYNCRYKLSFSPAHIEVPVRDNSFLKLYN